MIGIAETYRRSQVETAPPLKLIAMLYDGMLNFLQEAQQALHQDQMEMAHNALLKVQRIVEELDCALDLEKGGDLARTLRQLYDLMLQNLIFANITKSASKIEEAEHQVAQLREIWHTAAQVA